MRGGKKFVVFKTFNPPKSRISWANKAMEMDKLKKDCFVQHNTYLEVPAEWLGQQFIDDAEWLKDMQPMVYRHEYMGEAVGGGTNVFDNVEARLLTDEEIRYYDNIYQGIDWGWYPDPFQWVKVYYVPAKKELYIFDELRCTKTPNKDAWDMLVNEKGVTSEDSIVADSAEQKSIADFRSYGANIRGAEKGANSIRYGVKWLQSLNKIIIDPQRCPNAYREFMEYEYVLTKNGEPTSNYRDEDNHCLTGDTLVETPNGSVTIKDLVGKSGAVYSYDIPNRQKTVAMFENCRKTQENVEIYEIETESGVKFKCTSEHLIFTTENMYIAAFELTENDIIMGIHGNHKIKRVKKLKERQDVYNLEVPKYHNFVINGGIIVHNCIDSTRYALERVWRRRGN